MGAGILDRVIVPTQVKNGNSLSTRLHKLAHLQVLKLGSSPNLYKLSHGDLLPSSRSFSQHLPACRSGPEFSSAFISAPTTRRAFHIPNRRKQAVLDTSETADQPPIVRKDGTRPPDLR